MDWDNLALVQAKYPDEHQGKARLLTEFCQTKSSQVVPDPCYCGNNGFEEVLDLVEDACEGLIRHVKGRVAERYERLLTGIEPDNPKAADGEHPLWVLTRPSA